MTLFKSNLKLVEQFVQVCYLVLHTFGVFGGDRNIVGDSSLSQPPNFVLYALPVILALHLLTFFACHWSIRVKCAVGFIPLGSGLVDEATVIRVRPSPNSGVEALVPIVHHDCDNGGDVKSSSDLKQFSNCSPILDATRNNEPLSPPRATFTFQKTGFWWVSDPTEGSAPWQRVDYPTHSHLSSYLQCRGYETQAQFEAGAQRW
jgi:hypothetical protein